jgi:glycosyltransferase involved in cell wall biosynthesis
VEKGVLDLVRAFARVAREGAANLVFVGPDEEALHHRIAELCMGVEDRVRFVGFTEIPERYMDAADVLCLPSYREGFSKVIVEAAACGLPVVASDIYGITDAVVAGTTGILHAPGDVDGLTRSLIHLLKDGSLRVQLGAAGLERAQRLFSDARLTDALLGFYGNTLDSAPIAEIRGIESNPETHARWD